MYDVDFPVFELVRLARRSYTHPSETIIFTDQSEIVSHPSPFTPSSQNPRAPTMFLKKHIAEAESLPERHRGNEHHTPRLRPYVDMIISAFQDRRFQRRTSVYQKRDLQDRVAKKSWTGPPSETIYGGISVCSNDNNEVVISLAVRDTTYFLDFSEHRFPIDERAHPSADVITDFVLLELRRYEHEHLEKFVGMALPRELAERCPHLCPRLWRELDIVPLVLHGKGVHSVGWINREYWNTKTLDEQAESVARKCITFFGPNKAPLLQVGYRGCVEVDCGFHAVLATLPDYELTVGSRTWNSVLRYAEDLKKRKVKVAFFSATPQGGGVALMRHALVRFAEALGVDFKWYVPRPRPAVFRITKTNHNIFQGVSKPDERLTEENKAALTDWIVGNAKRYWLGKGGPLCAPPEGGADIIVIDDPQMPGLIPLIKEVTPLRPVIYRSHIQMRSDLIADPTTPQAEAWNYFWDSIKCADLFISHPVASFVPHMVPPETVGYLPASTDWASSTSSTRTRNSASAGAEKCLKDEKPPKLLVCGHGSVDDPDGVAIYDAVIEHIEDKLPHLKSSICVMHIPPSDQILNALLSKARVALQLSTREGFEVKVSEALHKGKPVIATLAGGIPLQVQDGKNGFLVEVGDTDAVAQHLFALWTDDELYYRLSSWAADSVSDEVSTVGNALSWLYLASELSKGRPVAPHERWINDLAREEAGEPYGRHENRLRRTLGHDKGVGVAEFGLCLRKSRHAGVK
ncbi:trehalose synthase [Histoplasma capsulatum H143]|uniref:Trehalose synthase n=1 Tax=Ajellomyces capsulatus (strain H143) TaxID=544712 RepID=C6HGH0_AJECH|nr:trehalose synthase [Histoplasma capsulatum H143]